MWFACLDYGNIEFLIPHDKIQESSYSSQKDEKDFLFSECVKKIIAPSLIQTETSNFFTRFTLNSKNPNSLCTDVVPRLEEINKNDFHPLNKILADSLNKKGIISLRFTETKIQYLLDIELLEEAWKKIK